MTRKKAQEIETEATRWVAHFDHHGRSPDSLAALDAWLLEDDRHRGAYLQAEAAWVLLDGLASSQSNEDSEPEPRFSRRRLMSGGAAIAASLVAGGVFLFGPDHYSTALGEIRQVPLADGSIAAINTASDIKVSLDRTRRRVQLARGEAWFAVAKDRMKPFVVEAGPVRVQAVGTAFGVRRFEKGAEILVTEGVVEAWVDGAEGHRIRLKAGERAFIADNAAITAKPAGPSDVDRALAWRQGRISLAGDTLAHAVQEFNRYNIRQIEIRDVAVGEERLYGQFHVNDPEGFAASVRVSMKVPVVLDDPNRIMIGDAPPNEGR